MKLSKISIGMAAPKLASALLLGAALATAAASGAFAHKFNLVVIAPVDSALRTEMQAAFLIASEERDSHAGQESDGHLGGLDVYLHFATGADRDDVAALAPDIVAVPLQASDLGNITTLASELGAAIVGPVDPAAPANLAMLEQASDPGLAPFARRYQDATDQAPGSEALAIYLAARQTDIAVRQLGGVDDRQRLRDLLSR